MEIQAECLRLEGRQAVVQLDFTDGPGAEAVLVQQPDEGNEL